MATFLSSLWESHQTLLSLYVLAGTSAGLLVLHLILATHPGIREMRRANRAIARTRREKAYYSAVVNRSGLWGVLYLALIFGAVFPWSLTSEPQPWWHGALDCFFILMIYDLIYYLTHRYLFHGKALMWMHSIHHQQKNPCSKDSEYLHPLESCIGMGLFAATIIGVAIVSDGIGPVTAAITFILFLKINQVNHHLIEGDRFPFKYFQHLSAMHHVHHARFTGGNFATLSLFYDWLFGTYDTGSGWGKHRTDTGA